MFYVDKNEEETSDSVVGGDENEPYVLDTSAFLSLLALSAHSSLNRK